MGFSFIIPEMVIQAFPRSSNIYWALTIARHVFLYWKQISEKMTKSPTVGPPGTFAILGANRE